MRQLLKLMACVVCLVFLSACQQRDNDNLYDYLMLHPNALRGEIQNCRTTNGTIRKYTPRCKVVLRAAENMMDMIERQQRNPERFGQDVLRLQMDVARLQKQIQQEVDNGKKKKLIEQEKKKSQQLSYEVAVMLGVIGLSSPE